MQDLMNFEILDIGLYYIGHFNSKTLRILSNSICFEVPLDRIDEFCQLFPDINWEDGAYLEQLKGRYMRAIIEKGRVIGLKHITKDLTYMYDSTKKSEV